MSIASCLPPEWHSGTFEKSRVRSQGSFAAVLSSRVWVPLGNTGRARVNALTPMGVPPDLRDLVS